MKLKKETDFSVFANTEILTAPRFDAFSFVSKDSLSAWNEVETNVWNTPNSSSTGNVSITSAQGHHTTFAQPQTSMGGFSNSFMDEVSSSLEGLAFVEKTESQIWNSSSFDSSLDSNSSSPTLKKKSSITPPEEDKTVIEEELSRQNLYKTELCRSFADTGICRYGHKCQFAHGTHEVRPVLRHPKYKTEVCKKFTTTGSCPYGVRCRFIHPLNIETNIASPPGSPTPQPSIAWSNTWATPAPVEEKKSSMKKAPQPIGGHIRDSPETARRLAFFQSIA